MNPDQMLTLTIRRRQLDHVLTVLAQRPYAEVAGLIEELARQVAPAAAPAKLEPVPKR